MDYRYLLTLTLLLILPLSSCTMADPRPDTTTPTFNLRDYFNGTLDAYGMFQDRGGDVKRQFHVVMEASWQGDEGILDEQFRYSDGSRERRVWHLTDLGAGRYRGRADDVIGEANGEVIGNALHWNYTLALPVDGRVYHVKFDDWMYQIDDRVVLNRAEMSKWGIRLGEVTLSFVKRDVAPAATSDADSARGTPP